MTELKKGLSEKCRGNISALLKLAIITSVVFERQCISGKKERVSESSDIEVKLHPEGPCNLEQVSLIIPK